MSQDYKSQLQQIQQSYRKISNLAVSNMTDVISLKDIKDTLGKIDDLLTNIKKAQLQGLDMDRVMFFKEKYQALNREYEYAQHNQVDRLEFTRKIQNIVIGSAEQRVLGVVTQPQSRLQEQKRLNWGTPIIDMPAPRSLLLPDMPTVVGQRGGVGFSPDPLPPAPYEMQPVTQMTPGFPRSAVMVGGSPVRAPSPSSFRTDVYQSQPPQMMPQMVPYPQPSSPGMKTIQRDVHFNMGNTKIQTHKTQKTYTPNPQPIDPWKNTNPWSNPATPIAPAAQKSKSVTVTRGQSGQISEHIDYIKPPDRPKSPIDGYQQVRVRTEGTFGVPNVTQTVNKTAEIILQPGMGGPLSGPQIARTTTTTVNTAMPGHVTEMTVQETKPVNVSQSRDYWNNRNPWSGPPTIGLGGIKATKTQTKTMVSEVPFTSIPPPPVVMPMPNQPMTMPMMSGVGPAPPPVMHAAVAAMNSQMNQTRTPPVDPWQNHNPWSNPPTTQIQQTTVTKSTLPVTPPAPPPIMHAAVAAMNTQITQTKSSSVDPWQNTNPWSNPPTSQLQQTTVTKSNFNPPAPPPMPLPSSSIPSYQPPPPGLPTPQPLFSNPVQDPWNNRNPWSNPPTTTTTTTVTKQTKTNVIANAGPMNFVQGRNSNQTIIERLSMENISQPPVLMSGIPRPVSPVHLPIDGLNRGVFIAPGMQGPTTLVPPDSPTIRGGIYSSGLRDVPRETIVASTLPQPRCPQLPMMMPMNCPPAPHVPSAYRPASPIPIQSSSRVIQTHSSQPLHLQMHPVPVPVPMPPSSIQHSVTMSSRLPPPPPSMMHQTSFPPVPPIPPRHPSGVQTLSPQQQIMYKARLNDLFSSKQRSTFKSQLEPISGSKARSRRSRAESSKYEMYPSPYDDFKGGRYEGLEQEEIMMPFNDLGVGQYQSKAIEQQPPRPQQQPQQPQQPQPKSSQPIRPSSPSYSKQHQQQLRQSPQFQPQQQPFHPQPEPIYLSQPAKPQSPSPSSFQQQNMEERKPPVLSGVVMNNRRNVQQINYQQEERVEREEQQRREQQQWRSQQNQRNQQNERKQQNQRPRKESEDSLKQMLGLDAQDDDSRKQQQPPNSSRFQPIESNMQLSQKMNDMNKALQQKQRVQQFMAKKIVQSEPFAQMIDYDQRQPAMAQQKMYHKQQMPPREFIPIAPQSQTDSIIKKTTFDLEDKSPGTVPGTPYPMPQIKPVVYVSGSGQRSYDLGTVRAQSKNREEVKYEQRYQQQRNYQQQQQQQQQKPYEEIEFSPKTPVQPIPIVDGRQPGMRVEYVSNNNKQQNNLSRQDIPQIINYSATQQNQRPSPQQTQQPIVPPAPLPVQAPYPKVQYVHPKKPTIQDYPELFTPSRPSPPPPAPSPIPFVNPPVFDQQRNVRSISDPQMRTRVQPAPIPVIQQEQINYQQLSQRQQQQQQDFNTVKSQSLASDHRLELCPCCPNIASKKNRIFTQSPPPQPPPKHHMIFQTKQSELLRQSHVGLESSKVQINNWLDSFSQPPFQSAKQQPSDFQPSTKPHQQRIQQSEVHQGIVLQALRPKPPLIQNPQIQQQPSQQQSLNFDTMPMHMLTTSLSNSKLFSEAHLQVCPKNLRNITRANLLRNKVAFFKQSMVIVKDDPEFEIAFKRSDLDDRMQEVRVIIYVNNKTSRKVPVDVTYEYDEAKYQPMISTRLKCLFANRQGREQLTIKLKDIHKTKPQSFITAHFKFDQSQYDIVLPILFLRFQQPTSSHRHHHHHNLKSLKLLPCKPFTSPHTVYELLPMRYINDSDEVEFLQGEKPYRTETGVESRQCRQIMGLSWFEGVLQLRGSENWVDMLGWVMSDTRI